MFKKVFLLVGVLAFLFLTFNLSSAQMPGMPGSSLIPKMYGEFKMPPVGTWVKYKSTYSRNGKVNEIKYAIVGKETSGGKEFYWYELEFFDPEKKDVTVLKMLVSGNPDEQKNLKRFIVKRNKEQAKELPDMLMQMMTGPKESKAPQIKEIGKETLKTPSGEFLCARKEYTVETKSGTQKVDVWANSKIPIYGAVKMVSEGKTTELLGYGTGAVTAITEEPTKPQLPGAPTVPK